MKYITPLLGAFLSASILLSSCQNHLKEKEIELRNRELAIKEQELALEKRKLDTANQKKRNYLCSARKHK